jgi:hypothetical protein
MKNASFHDDMIEDKYYGIEVNHVPRRYNE